MFRLESDKLEVATASRYLIQTLPKLVGQLSGMNHIGVRMNGIGALAAFPRDLNNALWTGIYFPFTLKALINARCTDFKT